MPCPHGALCQPIDGQYGAPLLEYLTPKPGFMRVNVHSELFTDCKKYHRTAASAIERCCPSIAAISSSMNTSSISFCGPSLTKLHNGSREQCAPGYSGIACRSCAEGYVASGRDCIVCEAGSSLSMILTVTIVVVAIPFGLCLLAFLICCGHSSKEDAEAAKYRYERESEAQKGFLRKIGLLKTLISFAQIMSSMTKTMTNVPFPANFRTFLRILDLSNIQFLQLFNFANCSLSGPFFFTYLSTIIVPPTLFVSACLAFVSANLCRPVTTRMAKSHRRAQTIKVMVSAILLIYPSVCSQCFALFNCIQVEGFDGGLVLDGDFAQICWEGDHTTFASIGVAFIIVFVIGIPLATFVVLARNMPHLYDATSKKHVDVIYGEFLFLVDFFWLVFRQQPMLKFDMTRPLSFFLRTITGYGTLYTRELFLCCCDFVFLLGVLFC
jgi:hypothetical protein